MNKTKFMNRTKLLTKLLQEPENEFALLDFLDHMLAEKLRDNQDNPPYPTKTDKNNYIGIEVECFSELTEIEVMELVLEHDLEKNLNIGDDSSVQADYGNTYELRILSLERELPILFTKLGAFFKAGKFGTNDTCGLHVHLDMRNRDVDKCYNKLLQFQHIMFPLVSKDRWTNDYCLWASEDNKRERNAVNYSAYDEHKTIEIRLHHGTTNVKTIHNWIKLLLRAIRIAPIKNITSKAQAVKWVGKDKVLKSYVKKAFKNSWFQQKWEVMEWYNDDDYGGDEDIW